MVTLVVEDGSGSNPSANSYNTVEELRWYALALGIDLSAESDDTLGSWMIKAMDYLEAQHSRFKGNKTNANQPLQWPRADVWDVELSGALMPSDELPRLLVYAQLALAMDARDNDLLPTDQGAKIQTKVEGTIELKYVNPGSRSSIRAFASANALLAPLYRQNGLYLVRE